MERGAFQHFDSLCLALSLWLLGSAELMEIIKQDFNAMKINELNHKMIRGGVTSWTMEDQKTAEVVFIKCVVDQWTAQTC